MSPASRPSRRRFVASALSLAALAAMPTQFHATSIVQPPLPTSKGDEMTALTPYLLFDGSCAPAMEFYKSVFGGELNLTKVKDSAAKDHMAAFQQDKVLNAHLKSGKIELSSSDWLRPQQTPVRGNTVCLYLSGGTLSELKSLFEKLSEGASITDPLKEEFFGFYGALNDRFGVRWMFLTNEK
jgi:PhnB protein